ncbi:MULTISPECIES: Type 1 glutamine amidotransferase-like domain-containing protein [unclassified Isoptericola]|uniref:Type 1 glutamine amidotransferase-like domain-containing protein n=1 Tax=unclassified Isoptericola TaxID=2623355 RepID=UPI00364DD31E
MHGDLWFGCGSAEDERELWCEMLGGRTARIVYWPFALPPATVPTADAWLRGGLSALGVPFELDTWESLAGRSPTELTTADVLFVGGGNTFRLLDHVRRHGFVPAVREFWRSGGDYYGGSAGAVLACESIAIADGHDPNEPGLTDLDGLGLVEGATILPHFDVDHLESAERWAHRHGTTVLGIPETVGLHCTSDGATVVGSGFLTVVSPSGVEHRAPGDRLAVAVAGADPGP